MPITYKLDILAALKEAGYNTNRLRKEKLLSEGVIQALRENKYISLQNVSKICDFEEYTATCPSATGGSVRQKKTKTEP